jgi:type I restriction enzyme S subunit
MKGGRAHGLLNVTPSDFFNLKITIPALTEQVAIARVLQSADKEIELLETKLEKIKEQKLGLMQQLLTGTKRIKQGRKVARALYE